MATMPTSGSTGAPDWIWGAIIAHRGLHDERDGVPENTLAAFARACDADVPVELDVRMLADRELAVVHDASVERVTGVRMKVSELSSTDILSLKVLGSEHTIPLFDDVLRLIDGRIPILVECKGLGILGISERRLVEEIGDYEGRLVIASFSPLSLLQIRLAGYRGPLGLIVREVPSPLRLGRFALRALRGLGIPQPAFFNVNVGSLCSPLVQELRRSGLPVVAWGVESAADARQARTLADGMLASEAVVTAQTPHAPSEQALQPIP
jgi:glycerophosphoryl diester phosphodiesterase